MILRHYKVLTVIGAVIAAVTIALVALKLESKSTTLSEANEQVFSVSDLDERLSNTSVARSAEQSSAGTQLASNSRYPDNKELAKQHIRLADTGEPYLPFDIELDFEKNFTFSDGSTIPIQYKVRNRFSQSLDYELDDGINPNFLDSLVAAAKNGNNQAAVRAYEETKKCQKFVDAKLNGVEAAVNATDVELERCQLVGEGSLDRALQTLKQAADRGSAPAQELYAKSVLKNDPEEAQKYFRKLWESGYSWGAGGFSQTAPPIEDMTFEEQIEYEAFEYVSYAISMAYYDGVDIGYVADHAMMLENNRNTRETESSLVLQQQAQNLAKKLLSENSECCISFTSTK